MSQSVNWTCPFCGRHTTINDDRFSQGRHDFNLGNKYGDQSLNTWVISCPNDECRELTIRATIGAYRSTRGVRQYDHPRQSWDLAPKAAIKVFPDYVPAPILEDYREACLIQG